MKRRKGPTIRHLELHFDSMLETIHALHQVLETVKKTNSPQHALIEQFNSEWRQFLGLMSALDARIKIVKGKGRKKTEWLN